MKTKPTTPVTPASNVQSRRSKDKPYPVNPLFADKLTEAMRRNKVAMAAFHGNGEADIKDGEGEV